MAASPVTEPAPSPQIDGPIPSATPRVMAPVPLRPKRQRRASPVDARHSWSRPGRVDPPTPTAVPRSVVESAADDHPAGHDAVGASGVSAGRESRQPRCDFGSLHGTVTPKANVGRGRPVQGRERPSALGSTTRHQGAEVEARAASAGRGGIVVSATSWPPQAAPREQGGYRSQGAPAGAMERRRRCS